MEEAQERRKTLPFHLHADLSVFMPATDEEKKQQEIMRPSSTLWRDGVRNFRKNRLAFGSLLLLVFIVFAIFIVPLFVPYGYDEIIRIDGKRDKSLGNLKPMEWSLKEQEAIDKGATFFRTCSEQIRSDGIILSGRSTGRAFHFLSAFLPV